MSDLYDIAKPIRDAAMAETLRAIGPEADPVTRDGATLGAHLIAVIMAWGSTRHDITHGLIRDGDLLDTVGYGVGLLVGNAGMIYRDMIKGEAVSPLVGVSRMIQRAVPTAMTLARRIADGTAEVAMPIGRQQDGTLGAKPFDVMDMLGEQKR